ncbi:MAG: cold shock domain-containing protein [Pseudomonadota bacterium]
MPKPLIVAVTSALLLAAAVTELSSRLWPQSYLALLLLSFVALLINGAFNVRQATGAFLANSAPEPAPQQPKPAERQPSNRSSRSQRTPDRGGEPKSASRPNRPRHADRDSDRDSNRDSGRERAQGRGNERRSSSDKRQEQRREKPTPVVDGPRETGTVKWFQRNKGFGFVIRENGEEIFVHQRSIRSGGNGRGRPALRDGERVSFVVTQQDRGPQAEDVVPESDSTG